MPTSSRLAQIVAWLDGSDEPPLIVLDECHKVRTPERNGSNEMQSKRGMVVGSRASMLLMSVSGVRTLPGAGLMPASALHCADMQHHHPAGPQAKNLLPSSGAAPTQTARAVVELQARGARDAWLHVSTSLHSPPVCFALTVSTTCLYSEWTPG